VSVKVGLPPIAGRNARLFILGSLPGDASLAARKYYAHPSNQFWKLLGGAIGAELHAMPYADRLALLAHRRIGLWDVVASAVRPGSLDQSIRNAGHNAIGQLLSDFPEVGAIAFNGATAARIGRALLGHAHGLALIDLPSSSAANTRPLSEKAESWARLAEWLPTAQSSGDGS
jgi:hypoxanthine-DNA glycosylase